jgi:PiT family inorganic phosphate transporter
MGVVLVCLFNVLAGFNDGGNLMATVLPSRVPPALLWLWLTLVVALGPLVLGTAVAHTIVYGIVALPRERSLVPNIAAAATATVLFSWWRRLPTSMSLALIGAMVGASVVSGSLTHWPGVARALLGFVAVVLLGFVVGFGSFRAFLWGHRRPRSGWPTALALLLTATFLGVAYGGNDLQKALGLLLLDGERPLVALLFAVLSFSFGTFVGAWRVARTVGARILHLRSIEALPTNFATALSVTLAARLGIPVSTSQTVDAAILGVGSAENPKHLGWAHARAMVGSWLLTPPLAFVLGVLAAWISVR